MNESEQILDLLKKNEGSLSEKSRLFLKLAEAYARKAQKLQEISEKKKAIECYQRELDRKTMALEEIQSEIEELERAADCEDVE